MYTGLHKPFPAACLVFAAGASLPLLLWPAASDLNLLDFMWEGPRGEALERRMTSCRLVTEAKQKILEEVIAGRLTLRQAAQRFVPLNAQFDDGNDDLVGTYRRFTEEEPLCRSVLAWAEVEAWHRPELAPVLARLREEFREKFGHPPEPLLVSSAMR
jgi:hypothetical protein